MKFLFSNNSLKSYWGGMDSRLPPLLQLEFPSLYVSKSSLIDLCVPKAPLNNKRNIPQYISNKNKSLY